MRESLTEITTHETLAYVRSILQWQRESAFLLTIVGCLLALILLSGCHKPADPQTQRRAELARIKKLPLSQMPAGPSTQDALKYLIQLRRNGQLPDTEDASRHVDIHLNPFSTNYPMSRTFILKMTNSHFANHYVLVKKRADSSWYVKSAWQTDVQGKTNKIYSIQ